MKRRTVIWSCPTCDHWQWGTADDPPETCPDCRSDMHDIRPDRVAAIDTYYCIRFHERNEDFEP